MSTIKKLTVVAVVAGVAMAANTAVAGYCYYEWFCNAWGCYYKWVCF